MKWMIASDIHGSLPAAERMRARYEEEGAGRLILLGDLLYHGPRNDLPEGYDPKGVIRLLNGMKEELLCVRGNCDAEVDQMVLQFPVLADYALLETAGHMVFLTHGHLYGRQNPPPLKPGDVLIEGHTHVPYAGKDGDLICLNPGSVALPKEGNPATYMTLENGRFEIRTLSGELWKTLVLEAI